MKKYMKRMLSVFLILAMMFVLVACGGNNDKDKDADATTMSQGQSDNGDSTEPGGKQEPSTNEDGSVVTGQTTTKSNNDGGGKVTQKQTPPQTTPTQMTNASGIASTIKPEISRTTNRLGNPSQSFVNSLKGFELKILNPWKGAEVGSYIYEASGFVEKTVEARYQVVINEDGFWEGYNDTVTASLSAGKPQAHIYKVQDLNYAGYMAKKYFCDMTSAMRTSGVDMKEPWYNQEARKFLNVNNKQMAWMTARDYDPYLIYYNKDMISQAKLTDPEKLAKAGTWTWDKLKEYATKLTTSSRKGLVSNTQEMFLASLVYSNGGSLITYTSAGEPTTNITNSVVVNALSTLGTWAKSKVVDFMDGGDWTAAKKAFGNNQAAMIHATADFETGLSTSFTSKIGVVPFPKGPNAKTYNNVAVAQYIDFVPTQYAKNAAKILFIRNEMYRQSYRFWDLQFVYENQNRYKGEDLDILTELRYAKSAYPVSYYFGTICEKTGSSVSTSWTAIEVAQGVKTAKQAVEAYGDSIAKAYADVWKGYKITGK